jgi:tRNA modification GTPase
MTPDLDDTIVALSSARGSGARAIVRLSGPAALRCAATLFTPVERGAQSAERRARSAERGGRSTERGECDSSALCAPRFALTVPPARPRYYSGHVSLADIHSVLSADLYFWPAPRTYTGQELVELHTLSSGPLIDLLISQLLDAGARAAQPGEFTLRAFLAGKLDLTRAEAVLGIIEAGNRQELKQALNQLAGGVAGPLQALRDDLLNLLADVEAGLDFADEDIQFIEGNELLKHLARALAQLQLLRKQLEQRAMGDRPFRVVLVGRPNAGKSSLFNALVPSSSGGSGSALVSDQPGTTRDYLLRTVEYDGIHLELVDTAGWQQDVARLAQSAQRASSRTSGTIEAQAQALGREQAEQADLLLLCLEVGKAPDENETRLLARQKPPAVVAVATKCDLAAPPRECLATSAVTGSGVDHLLTFLSERARSRAVPAMASSLSRCRHHVESCVDHLRHAHEAVLFNDGAEMLALHLRSALEELGQLVGAVYTDDLLDRIFSRFCIGK